MIDKPMWQRGLLAILLVVAVGLFYAVSNVEEESAGPPGSKLVVLDEPAVPASGALLAARPEAPVDPVALEPEPAGDASEAAAADAIALSQTLGERSQSLDAVRIARTLARSRRIEALEAEPRAAST